MKVYYFVATLPSGDNCFFGLRHGYVERFRAIATKCKITSIKRFGRCYTPDLLERDLEIVLECSGVKPRFYAVVTTDLDIKCLYLVLTHWSRVSRKVLASNWEPIPFRL